MMKKDVWPVMLTPYDDTGSIDMDSLARLVDWYEENGVGGLFAVCQSSEMFYLSLRERCLLAGSIKKRAHVPVIASGHVSVSREDQLEEIKQIADTGVDAVILITNRLACDHETSEVWKENLDWLLARIDPAVQLGFYECPVPYKRLISDEELAFTASTGRFRFMKDTCCDLETLKKRAAILEGSGMLLYNANVSTLLDSVIAGCAGFSGVMANFHPDLYVWMLENYEKYPEQARDLQCLLTMCSMIERQAYPVNAKFHLKEMGIFRSCYARSRVQAELSATFIDEVCQMERLIGRARERIKELT